MAGELDGVPYDNLISTRAIFNRVFDRNNDTFKTGNKEVGIDPTDGTEVEIEPTNYVGMAFTDAPSTGLNLYDRFTDFTTDTKYVWDGTSWVEIGSGAV